MSNNKMSDFFAARVKHTAILIVLAGVALLGWKMFDTFWGRNQHVWTAKTNKDIAENMVLADQRVAMARTDRELACRDFAALDNDRVDSPECQEAEKQYQAALALKKKAVQDEAQTFSQPVQVQRFYNETYASAQTKPLPFYLFLLIGLVLFTGVALLVYPKIEAAMKRGRTGSDDLFPKKKGGFF